MTRKRNFKKLLWIALFTIIIVVSGYGLSTTGNMQNPFGIFTQTQGRPEGSAAQGAIANGQTQRQITAPPSGGAERGGSEQSIVWSRGGGVLFNLWFLGAVSAFVMVVQIAGGFMIGQARQRVPALAKARAG